jgi:RimJ/RimL family protein N-acetyltransferase
MRTYGANARAAQRAGTILPFVIAARSSRSVIGSTRCGDIDSKNRRLVIGLTWLAPEWQRTWANREAKYLLLRHVFEELDCVREEFKTDILNDTSRQALKGIGAT